MPAQMRAWYTPAEIEALAERRANICSEFKLAELARLSDYLHADQGTVTVSFGFAVGGSSWQALSLSYEAKLTVVCQRCLEPFELEIKDRVEFGIIARESMEQYLPEQVEPIVVRDDRFSPQALVEDELIVAVPFAPKHADKQCGGKMYENVTASRGEN